MDKRCYIKLCASVKRSTLAILLLSAGLFSQTFGQTFPESKLKITVRDDSGQLISFRLQVFNEGKQIVQLWERGKAIFKLPPGKHTILISHGFNYDAVRIDTLNLPGGVTEKTVTLRKRYDLSVLGCIVVRATCMDNMGRRTARRLLKTLPDWLRPMG